MSATQRRLWYMQRLNLFAGLPKEEVEALAGRLHDRVLEKRQVILDPESRGDRIYLVKTGAVRVYQVSPDGRELTTAILRPGQLLGTAALAGVRHQTAIAEALEPQTCVCDATADEFLRMMSAHPVLAAKMMVTLARQARRLEQQLEQLAFREVPVRLAQALIQLAEDNGGELPANITHDSRAKLISSTRETVSKTLGQFAEQGLLELGYRRIRVLDWPACSTSQQPVTKRNNSPLVVWRHDHQLCGSAGAMRGAVETRGGLLLRSLRLQRSPEAQQ